MQAFFASGHNGRLARMIDEPNDADGAPPFLGGYDVFSKGTPGSWAASVLKAKGGDPNAVVMLRMLKPDCYDEERVCELVEKFPYHLVAHALLDDYAVAFDEATSLIDEACAEFVPQ